VIRVVIRHWKRDESKATVTINGIPFFVKDFEVSPAGGGYEPIEKKVVDLGRVIMKGPPTSRDIKFTCEFIEFSKAAYEYVKALDGQIVTICSPHVGGCIKGHMKAEIKFSPSEAGYFDAGARDHFGYGEITVEIKETAELPDDVKIPLEEEKKMEENKKATTPAAAVVGEAMKFKPSCAFCMKYDGYKYRWYTAVWELICKHCGGKLTREENKRVPEGQLHCTKCGANYCGVCGREKVWNRTRAEKYRIKNIQKPKPA